MLHHIDIIGMGALGVLYGHLLEKSLPAGALHFIADAERIARYREKTITCNGEVCHFAFADAAHAEQPADLIIFATKATGLADAIESVRGYVGENTLLLSVLNGISSEKMLAEAFGEQNVIPCIARGMDATKLGDALTYSRTGQLIFGADRAEKQAAVAELSAFFTQAGVPHTVSTAIEHDLWEKFMMNVGVNQAMMVYETNYGGMIRAGEPRDTMIAAMREVIALSERENILLTEEDLRGSLAVIDSLDPAGYTSMRQDGINHRPSEVEIFAGTVLRLAEKYGMDVPVNRFLYERVKQMEAAY